MPFNYNHPVRVAERAATLDMLSGGRVNLGAGRGATLQEMSLCRVDPERTYLEVEESLRMIGRCGSTTNSNGTVSCSTSSRVRQVL